MRGNTAIRINRPSNDTALASLDARCISDFEAALPAADGTRSTVDLLRRELEDCRATLAQVRAAHDSTTAALRCARSELRLVSAALMSAQEMDRKRIACELHDSIGQALGTVGFGVGGALDMLRANDTAGAELMLLRIADQARQAIGEVRRIAMDLRPATLDNLGIIGTLSWFFREFRAVHPQLVVVTDIDVREASIPATLTTAIYRVVQEACGNVVRHAQASAIRVALYHRPGLIMLRVGDNGCGIAPGTRNCLPAQGMGLRSMRDRVEFSGGSFCVAGEPGAGTSVVATWPLSGAYCETSDAEDAGPAFIEEEQ